MSMRPPSVDHGVVSFVWALLLGAFVWIGLLGVGASEATAVSLAVLSFGAIFVFVRVRGEEEPRTPQRPRTRDGVR